MKYCYYAKIVIEYSYTKKLLANRQINKEINMEIFDGHIHLDSKFTLQKLENDMGKNGVLGAIVMPNPIDESIFAKTDGIDVSVGGARIKFSRDGSGYYFEHARELGLKPQALDADYFYNLNKELIESCSGKDNVYPFVLLPCNRELASEILKRLENDLKGRFFGLKFHPNAYSFGIHKAGFNHGNFNYDYPVIIHTGVTDYDKPENALKFAKQYGGKVCLAHSARFDEKTLKQIEKMPNVYIDISPSYYLSSVGQGTTQKVFDGQKFAGMSEEDLLKYLLRFVPEDRILAGSDAPFGSIKELKSLAEKLQISESLKQKIFSDNARSFCELIKTSEFESGQENMLGL